MENSPENKPKLEIKEIKETIKESEEAIKKIENELKEDLAYLKEQIDSLEIDVAHLSHMESSNEVYEEYKEEMGKEPSLKRYSEEEIHKLKEDIEKTKKHIEEIHAEMTENEIYKLQFQSDIDLFKKYEEKFRKLLLKIDTQRLS